MKRIALLMSFPVLVAASAHGQLKIDNATFHLSPGSTLTLQGDLTSNTSIQGTGLVLIKGTSAQTINMGGYTIPNLEIDNTITTNLASALVVSNSFVLSNGKLQLNGYDLRLGTDVTAIGGSSSSKFIVTNGTGRLIKSSLGSTAFNFPVGYSATEFNPLTISNSGTADSIGVRCLENVLAQGTSGSVVPQSFANNSWVVTEAVAGGSNLSLSGEWAAADEPGGFNRVKSGIARYTAGTDWDLPASNVLAASGSGPYSHTRTNITQPGVFAIADLGQVNAARLNLKVYLQGAYNIGSGMMNDDLRNANLIPTTQPYNSTLSAAFARVGVYDGSTSVNETIPNTAVLNVAAANDDVVDWVFLSLLDAANPAVKLQTRAAFVQRDGDVVEYDGGTGTFVPVRMPIDEDKSYHLLISHRNHLGIRTAASQLLQDNTVFNYNFTGSQAQAYQNAGITTNAAMKNITGSVYGLWAGNVNGNNNVRFSGLGNDFGALVGALGGNQSATLILYSSADVNMNGQVRISGLNNDFGALVGFLGGNQAITITQH